MSKPQHVNDLFNSAYIKASDFRGKPRLLTISSVDREKLESPDGEEKFKGIVSFEGKDKRWITNRTNLTCLAEMFGPEVQSWVGRKIFLFPSEFNGEACIRVWGSPELEKEFDAIVTLPRRKPQKFRMHKTDGQPKKEEVKA